MMPFDARDGDATASSDHVIIDDDMMMRRDPYCHHAVSPYHQSFLPIIVCLRRLLERDQHER
jgi:hypothetical protein